MDFERWFKEGTSRFERALVHIAAFLLLLVVVSQVLLTQPAVRQVLSLVDRFDGEPYVPRLINDDGPSLELSIVNDVD